MNNKKDQQLEEEEEEERRRRKTIKIKTNIITRRTQKRVNLKMNPGNI